MPIIRLLRKAVVKMAKAARTVQAVAQLRLNPAIVAQNQKHHRLRLKCRVPEDKPNAPSLTPLYGSANWMERETYDMYGVVFDDHPDLRRILLYPEFVGYPLRKDYDKLHEQPLFESRYEGVRETDEKLHPRVGVELPIHGTEVPR